MPKSKGRKKKRPTSRPRERRPSDDGLPPLASLIRPVLRGGRELLDVVDPLDAEVWASQVIGVWFKVPLPPLDRVEFEHRIRSETAATLERAGTPEAMAILCALAAMEPDAIAGPAQDAARRLTSKGVTSPSWAAALKAGPESLGGWVLTDDFGDQDGYHLQFRYPESEQHTVVALIDHNIGGICKDAFCGFPTDDIRGQVERDPEAIVKDVDAETAAAVILRAIEIGDQYLDNDWTPEFKHTRALVRARMHRLNASQVHDGSEPLSQIERDVIINEFLEGTSLTVPEVAERIASHALDYACDYTPDGDPYRWSPIVVECFLLDWLPRKALLDTGEIRAMADVLKAWVSFALKRRGLSEAKVAETMDAVDRFIPEFRRAATDQGNFGPAKSLVSAMLASGVDLKNQAAVDDWIADFNQRPFEQRDELLGPSPFDPDRDDR